MIDELEIVNETGLLVTARESGASAILSLLAGSSAPVDPPPDIATWARGHGDEATLAEWLRPAAFLRRRARK